MRFRCPYCKEIIGDKPQAQCPHCGKAMVDPDKFQKKTARERKRIKQRIAREAERKKQIIAMKTPAGSAKKSGITFMFLAILTVIGALLVGKAERPEHRKEMPAQRAVLELRALQIASENFRDDCGFYPRRKDGGLISLVINPAVKSWRGPYVNKIKADPWHNSYLYVITNGHISVFSAGPDGIAGTDDDLYPYTKNRAE